MSYLNILYPHQRQSYLEVQELYRQKYRRVLFRAPTGWGKSKYAACILRSAYELGRRVLLIAPRIAIVRQLRQDLIEIGIPKHDIGVIQAPNSSSGFKFQPQRPVQIALIDSLLENWSDWEKKQINAVKDFSFIVVDEVHMFASKERRVVWDWFPKSFFLGLTATPIGSGGSGFESMFDYLHCSAFEPELITTGFLPYYEYFTSIHADISDIKAGDDGEFTKTQKQEIVKRINTAKYRGDLVREWRDRVYSRFGNVPTIIFAENIQHARDIAEEYCNAGINAVCVDSRMKATELRENLRKFAAGEATHLVNVEKISTGFDLSSYCRLFGLPDISIGCVQMVAYTENIARIKQMFGRGRGIRLKEPLSIWWNGRQKLLPENSKFVIYLDHAGIKEGLNLLPDTVIEWSLEGKPKKDKKKGTKLCPDTFPDFTGKFGCGRSDVPRTAKKCPYCGYNFPDIAEEDEEPEVIEMDKTVELQQVKMTAQSRFEEILARSQSPYFAFEQFVRSSPTWQECYEAAKRVDYKTPAAFHKWVEGQRIEKGLRWIVPVEELLPILEILKGLKKESPLGTYRAWIHSCRDAYPNWMPSQKELEAISSVCGYKDGWVSRELRELQSKTADIFF